MRHSFTGRLWLLVGFILVFSPILAASQILSPDQIRTPTGDVNEFWDNLAFEDLTPAEQKTWAVLGWNARNWYAAEDVPDTSYLLWIQLSAEQQSAATALGYDQRYWDSIGFSTPKGDVDEFWYNVAYADLTDADKNAWAVLGWNSKNWVGTADVPETEFLLWSQLSDIQKAAATALGYSPEYWDSSVIRKPAGDVNEFWNNMAYADLTEIEKSVWAVLGWTSANWDGTAEVPDTEFMLWSQLSAEQREVASVLGYTQPDWDVFVIRRPASDVNEFWNNMHYADLTPAERKAWAVLGWDAKNWDSAVDLPETEYMRWAQLSPEQRASAASLGYGSESWDASVAK